MRSLLFFFISFFLCVTIRAQSPWTGKYTLTVHTGNLKTDGLVYFTYYNTTTKLRIQDSSRVESGLARFKGSLEEPILAQLRIPSGAYDSISKKRASVYPKDYFAVYLQPGDVSVFVKDSLSDATVKGSRLHEEYKSLRKLLAPFEKRMDSIYAAYTLAQKNKDSVGEKRADEASDAVDLEMRNAVYAPYVIANANKTPMVLYALSEFAGYDLKPDSVEALLKKISPEFQQLPSGKQLQERIDLARQTAIGKPVGDFTQTDTAGNPVSFSSFRGKYVLIDFWASWCGPCRAENPQVVRTFNHFQGKNFTIIGISLDRPGQKEKWIKAIHDDHLTWNHLSDLQFWNNAVARQFGILAIPQNILVDPTGKIIGKNLHGDELDKTLNTLLN